MDDERVTADPSKEDSEGDGLGSDSSPSFSYIIKAFEEACPYYLSIGMSYDEFWNQDVTLVKVYRKAEEMRVSRKNYENWLQGRYFYDALLCASPLLVPFNKNPKPIPYDEEPYALTQKEYEERQERARKRKEAEMIRRMEEFAKRFNSRLNK